MRICVAVPLLVALIVIVGIDEAQVDRGMAAIGDDREQDMIGLRPEDGPSPY